MFAYMNRLSVHSYIHHKWSENHNMYVYIYHCFLSQYKSPNRLQNQLISQQSMLRVRTHSHFGLHYLLSHTQIASKMKDTKIGYSESVKKKKKTTFCYVDLTTLIDLECVCPK